MTQGTSGSKGTVRVLQLYPRDMNIYGDWGNALVLQQRLKWHGYTPELLEYNPGDEFPDAVDVIVAGGGQDSGQLVIQDDLQMRADTLRGLAEDGAPMLVICGLYQLFGLRFSPLQGIPVYHPDVTVYEVKDAAGRHVGLWYFDPYARPGKRSGAWMNAYRVQERFDRDIPTIVSNNANFVKCQPVEPLFVSWTDGTTLFHELGHAVHGLNSSGWAPTGLTVRFGRTLLAGGPIDRGIPTVKSTLHQQ